MRLSDLRASLTLALLLLPLSASADVFINEIHYDNASTDEGEAIEVVATAGEDLSQYSIHYYTSASASTSGSVPASSPISCGSGNPAFGVINYPVNGLQNNGPKAMALVVGGSVIQFLSYEGALTATAGVANGLTSTDIGVAEDGGTAVGESLQLSGNGSTYADFTWNSAATNTFGACNNGQTFGAPVDNPPTVNATDPAEGDTDIPVNSTLSVTFSEPVTATAGAFTLSCNDAGSIGLNVSGGSTTFTLTPATALDFNDSCTLTIVAANVTDQDAPADNMAADVLVHFDTEIDNAPTLTASTPSNGASDFQVNENLSLTFSEPVDVTGSWFQIICSVSGNRSPANVAVSGGPTDYSLDPASDFIAGENCTLTFNTSAVTDQDGSADTLVDPGSIAFVPVADAPPAVLSTTPTDGDSSFPSAGDIVVMFSEPVTLTAGAFDLSCNTSSGISLSHAMSGTSFTINTGTALVAGDACTFTVDRTKVTDSGMQNPAANTVVNFTVATSSAGTYYDTVNTSSPEQLRCTLHNIIKGHTIYPYGWTQLEVADEAPDNVCAAGSASSQNYILDIYRNRCYEKVTDRSGSTDSAHYNREHVWPKSLGFNNSSLAKVTWIQQLNGCTQRPSHAAPGRQGREQSPGQQTLWNLPKK
ncbi:MAG: Ig-like domain-containing protein [Lysobacteraceae bacterium]